MSKKISKKQDNNKLVVSNLNNNHSFCKYDRKNTLFDFSHVTNKKGYSIDNLLKANDKNLLKEFLRLINVVSITTWNELSMRSKYNLGGFETLEKSIFKTDICDNFEYITDDTKLYVFRFGNADKYRMICHKSRNCELVLHVLAFDLDVSLYDHGK